MIRPVVIGFFWLLVALLASAPLWLSLPEPDAQAIVQAEQIGASDSRSVTLPLTRAARAGELHLRLQLPYDALSGDYLFVPMASQQFHFELNGHLIGGSHNRNSMVGMVSSMSLLLHLPDAYLHPGNNQLDVYLHSDDLAPVGLSRLYVGQLAQLTGAYHVRLILLEYLPFMVLAGQLLIMLVVGILWLYRPADELFGWLFLVLLLSMAIYLGMASDLIPHFLDIMPYLVLIGTAASMMLLLTVLLIARVPRLRWLKLAAVLVPGLSVLAGLTGLAEPKQLVLLVSAPVNVFCLLATTCVVLWAALARQIDEAWLLLLPSLLMTLTGFHDLLMLLGKIDSLVMLSLYYRPLMLIGIAMILMRQMGITLTQLDNVNVYLTQRLAQRETELDALHRQERVKAARQARSEERSRLTADLHDGLSGHLASIIALSEREQSHQVEMAAREALEDLRLVVHSLDIDEGDLPLALASLRERLDRQLKRAGVRLDWSMVRLPDISGVTPAQALNVLRILQEAVTNAVKHGKAGRITISGDSHEGRARILVENDGLAFPLHPDLSGSGMKNMKRRIRQLGGDIYIEPLDKGTRLSLLLPLRLPDMTAQ